MCMKMRLWFRFAVLCIVVVMCGFLLGCESHSVELNDKPLDSGYTNPDLLIESSWLNAHLNDRGLMIIDCRSIAEYDTGHIPNAINLQWIEYVDFAPVKMVLKQIAELEALLGDKGIDQSSKIIIYANPASSWGSEGRFFWMLEYLGHTDVHILNGGWTKWVADAYPTETTLRTLPSTTFTAFVDPSRLVTKDEIHSNIDNDNFLVLDTRTDEEYIGWQLYDEGRGGHIPGARQLPHDRFMYSDMTVKSAADIKTILDSIGVTNEKTVVAYCTAGIRSSFVYFILRLMGHPNAKNYDGSWFEWAADANMPVETLPNYEKLVYPKWINTLIDGGHPGVSDTPPTYPGNDWVIIDARSADDYAAGHIPEAVNLTWQELSQDSSNYYNLKTETEIASVLKGITPQTTLIIYADNDTSWGADGRISWTLDYMGLSDARILNGGWDVWATSGYPTETTANTLAGANYSGYTINKSVVADAAYTHDKLNDSNTIIVDVRSDSEWSDGHIPGAKHYEWSNVFDEDKTLKSDVEILADLTAIGVLKSKNPITHCAVGIRSAHTYFVLKLLGYSNIRNFDGSFNEWIATYPDEVE